MSHAWTLDGARGLLPDVRRRTAEAVAEVEALVPQRDRTPRGHPERQRVEQAIQRSVSRWIRAMEALGVEVKGVWLVDFDNGRGYYCWRWPEERLEYFHDYEEGFAGRVRIQ
jgi:hypothetical protein